MGSIISSIITGVTFCCCTAACSVCTSCLGNDKSTSDPPSLTSGRARSVFLLLISIGISFGYQYGLASLLSEENVANYTSIGRDLVDGWNEGCKEFDEEFRESCRGNSGVYRVTFSTTLFFFICGIVSFFRPTFNRELWFAKLFLYLIFVGAMVFVPSNPLFLPIYMQFSRFGAACFIIMQQIMFINIAYNWNESWVMRADKADSEEEGSGKLWLASILVSCAFLFIASLTAIGIMYHHFQGCAINTTFISVTLVLIIVTTSLQLTGEESSLLSSGIIAAWTTYLLYSALSNNPNGDCNPMLGKENTQGIFFGIAVTLVSLIYIGFSYTSNSKLSASVTKAESENNSSKQVKGIVTNDNSNADNYGAMTEDVSNDADNNGSMQPTNETWKLNVILALVSCWSAMVLTGWGEVSADGTAANPDAGKVSMWMIISTQWLCFTLYCWTITAPRLFPDRDFS